MILRTLHARWLRGISVLYCTIKFSALHPVGAVHSGENLAWSHDRKEEGYVRLVPTTACLQSFGHQLGRSEAGVWETSEADAQTYQAVLLDQFLDQGICGLSYLSVQTRWPER